jgi:sulfate permease, SulP family
VKARLATAVVPPPGLLGQETVPGLAGMHDVDDYPDAQTIRGLVVYRYDTPLGFANAKDFLRRALAAAGPAAGPAALVRAQRRGQRRGGLHRAGGHGGAAR